MKKGTLILWSNVSRISKGRLYVVLVLFWTQILNVAQAQCPTGYLQAQLNWDFMDYFHNSGSGGPYEGYIDNTQEQNQKFAIGKTWLSVVTSTSAMVNTGNLYADNGSHTGDVSGFTGEDIQYNPTGNGQTITITFNEEVYNTTFTLYDIDDNARIDVDAFNAADVAQNVSVTTHGLSVLSITNNNSVDTYVSDGSGNNLDNSSNDGTATFRIDSAINRIVITVTLVGSNPVFWLSDIDACVAGSFPLNYHQASATQPFNGPVSNQPQYILATPDNDGVYMVDPATGNAKFLFNDPTYEYVNSFAYDPYNQILYYVAENWPNEEDNLEVKKYDFKTGTMSTLISDVSALGIPTFNFGVESAGAAFYDGALYLGIEGGKYNPNNTLNDRPREAIVWKIEFDASLNPVNAYQVFGTNTYPHASNTSIHDWGDFLVKDGVLYDFSTARNSGDDYTESRYQHYDLRTGQSIIYSNPGSDEYSGQAGLNWAGDMFWLRIDGSSGDDVGSVGKYNGDGTFDPTTIRALTVVPGPYGLGPAATWPGGIGDASDPFRPPMDFGDAPASYDPDPLAPAVHETLQDLRLGSTIALEMEGASSTLADAEGSEEDAIGSEPNLNYDATLTFSISNISVFNNTGENATLVAWLDYNFNGVFEAGEGQMTVVSSNAATQFVTLTWTDIFVPLTSETHTFVRFRLTKQANGMTTANGMNGWFPDGEVEDFRVIMGASLPKDILSFTLNEQPNAAVKVNWSIAVEEPVESFEIMRSSDKSTWGRIATVYAKDGFGLQHYTHNDTDPHSGIVWYRIRVNYKSGSHKFTEDRMMKFDISHTLMQIVPNPANSYAEIRLMATAKGLASVAIFDQAGRKLLSQSQNVEPGVNNIRLQNLTNLAGGIYFVRTQLNGQTLNSKLVISRH